MLISPVCAVDILSMPNASPALSNETNSDRPFMYFTPEEIDEYAAYLENMSVASAYESEPLPNGSKSLLSLVPYIGKERDQGSCGNSWVWAPTGALEVALRMSNNVSERLSVQYFNSNWHNGSAEWNACDGGWPYVVAEFYNSTLQKTIPWSNANASFADYHWQTGNRSGIPASSISTEPNYPLIQITDTRLDTSNGQTSAINAIKSQINADIPVIYGFYLSKEGWHDFNTFWNNESESDIWNPDPYSGGEIWGGLAVLIVGYDDTGSDPYWTVLHSWGTSENRPNGLFRLKMDMNYNGTGVVDGMPYQINLFEILNTEYVPPKQAPGILTVTSKPSEAFIWIDDMNTGYLTPATIRNVSSGEHSLKLIKPGYFESVESFTIYPDQKTAVSIPMTQIGVLSVNSHPSGATIWIDGTDTREITNTTILLIPGVHEIRLVKSGYPDYSTEFTIKPGLTTPLQADLNQTG